MKIFSTILVLFVLLGQAWSCKKKKDDTFETPPVESPTPPDVQGWVRSADNPVLRDPIPNIPYVYEVASDPHVFFDENDALNMIYSGDVDEKIAIKLAKGTSWTEWTKHSALLSETGPSGLDIYKETPFYRKADNGKHQIFYIGYDDEETYQAQIYLAESDDLEGPYTQMADPVVPRGPMAGQEVYLITSPSIVEHEGALYMNFIGWDASPSEVTNVWVMGAVSYDDGYTWTDFQETDARIGMEGQVTKYPDGTFHAVRTGAVGDVEGIYAATANHPFGPWTADVEPILTKDGAPLETDEIIAPQLTFDLITEKPVIFYTGADLATGWWIMLATFN